MPDCAVVICAHTLDRWPQLQRAVDSVRDQASQVIVVIDHNDELEARARAILAAEVCPNPGAPGVSGARNAGVARARASIVAFLDDDAVAAPDWVATLCRAYSSPDVVGVGGHIEPAWEPTAPGWFPEEFHWVVGCSYRGLPTEAAPVRNAIGANMSFRADVFDAVGGFDEAFGRLGAGPAGCDETEFSIRVGRALPWARIVYEPAARVRHEVPPARASWAYFRDRCRGEGRSKAQLTRVAASRATAAERRYVTTTLPAGVARGLGRFARTGDVDAARTAGAIVAGLAYTTAAYARERVGG